MLVWITDLSKYIFAALLIFYAAVTLAGVSVRNKKGMATIYAAQITVTAVVHFMGFSLLAQGGNDWKYVLLYLSEAVYFAVVYLVYYRVYKNSPKILVNNMCLLLAMGFVMLARLNFNRGIKQFVICAAGTFAAFFVPAAIKKLKWLCDIGWLYCIAGLALLVAVLFCTEVFGAKLVLTFRGFSIQPAEFVKITYVLFVAAAFHKSVKFRQIAAVTLLAAAHVLILVLCTDLGAALIFFVVYIAMLYVATGKLRYVVLGAGAGGAASAAAYAMFRHVRQRVLIWLDPWKTIDTTGYQICQSLFAIGMGSWFGYGLGQGMPGKIPVAEKDFMFSAIAEEFGTFVVIALLLVCLANFWMIMELAGKYQTVFYRLIAVGFAVTYGFQVFLTVGGAMKMIPMTGVTLPFVSYGGSSMVSSLVMFSVINGLHCMKQGEGGDSAHRGKRSKSRKRKRKRK